MRDSNVWFQTQDTDPMKMPRKRQSETLDRDNSISEPSHEEQGVDSILRDLDGLNRLQAYQTTLLQRLRVELEKLRAELRHVDKTAGPV